MNTEYGFLFVKVNSIDRVMFLDMRYKAFLNILIPFFLF